jgi:hypothetical protein
MDEIISYKMCAVKVRNAKLRNYLKKESMVHQSILHFNISHISSQVKLPRVGQNEIIKKGTSGHIAV